MSWDVLRCLEASQGVLVLPPKASQACPWLNVSTEPRAALLNACMPSWIIPMVDEAEIYVEFTKGEVPAQLNERERRELEGLMTTRVGGKIMSTAFEGAEAKL